MTTHKLSLIVPCKNEETGIGTFIRNAKTFVDEVIIVDNNSSDNTIEVATAAGARVIVEKRHKEGIGYGYAHMSGMQQAHGDIIIAMDGDDTYPVEEIGTIVRHMDEHNLDFVSCSRFPLENPRAISRVRQLGITVLNLEVLILYGYRMQDILSGMWVMRRDVVSKLGLLEGGWDLSPEIKIAALTHPSIAFAEYHINHFERKHEPSKQQIIKTGVAHLLYILKRRFTTDLLPRYRNRKQTETQPS